MKIGKKFSSWHNWMLSLAVGVISVTVVGVTISRVTNIQQKQTKSQVTAPLPQRVEVVALARLEPRGEIIRVSGSVGERVARSMVSQGDLVKAGAILAYLESYQERLAERDYVFTQLTEAKQQLQAITTYAQAQIQEAQARINQIDRPGKFELEAQQATVRELEAERELAVADLQRSERLYLQGAISKQSLDRELSKTRQAQEQVNNAKASLIKLENTLKTNLNYARDQLRSQQANLPVNQIQTAVSSAEQKLKLAEARLQHTIIRAPRAGRILRVLTYPGEAIGQGARSANTNNGIFELGDTNQMFAVAEVYETDVGLVKLGQSATITSRNGAFSKLMAGKVAEIGWQIFKNNILDDDPAANADARVVEVKIRLDDSKSVEAFTNLQVDARINVR